MTTIYVELSASRETTFTINKISSLRTADDTHSNKLHRVILCLEAVPDVCENDSVRPFYKINITILNHIEDGLSAGCLKNY